MKRLFTKILSLALIMALVPGTTLFQFVKADGDTVVTDWSDLQAALDNAADDEAFDLSQLTSPLSALTFNAGDNKTFTLKGDKTQIDNVAFLFGSGNTVTIEDLNIKSANRHPDGGFVGGGRSTLHFGGEGNTLILAGENTVASGQTESVVLTYFGAAVGLENSAALTIQTAGNDPSASLTAIGGVNGAGIGGGRYMRGGTIVINSGTITASGGANGGAGVGSGYTAPGNGLTAGDITINGGTINAAGGGTGAGIGGGTNARGGITTITGGTIIAGGSGAKGGAGIGSGGGPTGYPQHDGGSIAISGGDITAAGSEGGAGIGGGFYSHSGNISIFGGKINSAGGSNASSSYGGAGIGGGHESHSYGIAITGGMMTAAGGVGAAGIGAGNKGNAYTVISITGGTITAAGGVSSMFPTVCGAGIGGGNTGSGGTVIITGGSIKAVQGGDSAQAIGKGGGSGTSGTIKDAQGNDVWLNTLAVPGKPDAPLAVANAQYNGSGYGINDVYTDAESKLYFYLPASGEADAVYVNIDNTEYVASYVRGNDHANEQTMLPGTWGEKDTVSLPLLPLEVAAVGYAGHEWWVVGNAEGGIYPQPNSITLYLKSGSAPFGTTRFSSSGGVAGTYYNGSLLKQSMESTAAAFPEKESNLINKRDILASDEEIGIGDALGQSLWPLSRNESHNMLKSFLVRRYDSIYWLRTRMDSYVYYVSTSTSYTSLATDQPYDATFTVRPAFNLDISSAFFATPTGGGKAKPSSTGVMSAINEVSVSQAIKFTFTDDSLATPSLKFKGSTSGTGSLYFEYSGASTGTDRYVSCILGRYGDPQYYLKLASSELSSSGSFTLPVAGVLDGTYALKIFCEEANGGNLSDFAGAPVSMTLTVADGKGTVSHYGGEVFDETPPVVASVTPSGTGAAIGGNVMITFDKAMDTTPGTVKLNTTTLTGGSWSDGNTKFTIPYSGLAYSTEYTVDITGFKDAAGNIMAANNSNSFTTAMDPAPSITTSSLPGGTVGTAYSQTLAATGEAPITWSIDSGALPAGLTISAAGIISGTPTTSGTFNFTVKATNGAGNDTKALSITVPVPTYSVTVANGTGDGSFPEGALVTITANAAPAGQAFDKWLTSDGVTFDNGTSANTTFVMPAKAVTVTATYKDLPPSLYAVNVLNDGNGTATANVTSAAADTEITLTAVPNNGYRFKEWQTIEGGVAISASKFVMPAGTVTVKAIFEPVSGEFEYKITAGANQAWEKGATQGVTITCNGTFSKFIGLKMDGVLIDDDQYTVVDGNTVVTLKASFLETLALGMHTVEFIYSDGSAQTGLTILTTNSGATDPNGNLPQTGDNSNMMIFLLIGGASCIVICAMSALRYKKKKKFIIKR